MKHLLSGIACTGVMLLSLSAVQAAPQYNDDNAWHQTRQEFYSNDTWRAHMFERIRMDSDHVQQVEFGQSDEDRIVNTKEEVSELQTRMAAGQYDQQKLDYVFGSLEKVVADNRLSPRDRDMLADDLSKVREYRANHENWR